MKNLILTLGVTLVMCSGAYTLTDNVYTLIAMCIIAGLLALWFIYEMFFKVIFKDMFNQ